ncbi:HD domain-containing phosphohydrolase [Moritella sp. Urea-trap-13]|uniref:HD domain-containing phosphohydrolase n=1 Tax=Moritella sp. Urea-trap-13 TaxID=2058327 RepID=UPI000C3408B0|nr:HD domain-containing phosphohydrolase [Moritella sp. Urea-trap-13]PKH08044.1 chemotaxis protein [Moritella sp. Urea-trap-13]
MKKSLSFRAFITSVCISIILLLSIVLIRVSINHSREVTTSLSEDIVASHAEELTGRIGLLGTPLATLLDTLAFTDFVHSKLDVHDPIWLGTLAKILAKSPHLSTLYFGDEQGNSFVVRPIYDTSDRLGLSAPEHSVIMVDYNQFNGEQKRIFFDKNMSVITAYPYDNQNYDPRVRPWFIETKQGGDINVSEPYYFYFFQHFGITFSRRSLDGKSVIAADFTLDSLNDVMAEMAYSVDSKIYLFTAKGSLLASNQIIKADDPSKKIALQDLGLKTLIPNLSKVNINDGESRRIEWQGQEWQLIITPMVMSEDEILYLVNVVSLEAVLADSNDFYNDLLLISLTVVVLSLFIVVSATRHVVRPLTFLVKSLEDIQRFSFKRRPYRSSGITEIDQINETMLLMEEVLFNFIQNLKQVARSTAPEEMSSSLVSQVQDILKSDDCLLFTNSRQSRSEFSLAANIGQHGDMNLQALFDINPAAFEQSVYELSQGEVRLLSTQHHSGFIIPLFNRNKQNTGALLICFNLGVTADIRGRLAFVQEFIGFNELVLEHLEAIEEQTNLFHAFVMMTASAVDVKSAYTGEHCKRVPELTRMLTEQVVLDKGSFSEFDMDKKQWEELLLAAWLHDCGKVSTPDFIMDKSTKLETVYDRIHEVRMRYEVLKRDADICYLQALLAGGDQERAQAECEQLKQTLDNEFAFVADCNLGSEFMADDKMTRLAQIAQRTWSRTLPDDIGISHQEKVKKTAQSLPIMETILSDKIEHLYAWDEKKKLQANGLRDFKIKQPEYQYNRGELYNLGIKAGTLTAEDRYNINEHVVQTYIMLDQLPYPEHLKNVPIIAGSHHERIDGKGYPLELAGDDIPLQGRIIAVADVFEALTASDRPYKEAKSLSLALKIMANMVKDSHLDRELFDLFLTTGVYSQYATEYLTPQQINVVDIESIRSIYLPTIDDDSLIAKQKVIA